MRYSHSFFQADVSCCRTAWCASEFGSAQKCAVMPSLFPMLAGHFMALMGLALDSASELLAAEPHDIF